MSLRLSQDVSGEVPASQCPSAEVAWHCLWTSKLVRIAVAVMVVGIVTAGSCATLRLLLPAASPWDVFAFFIAIVSVCASIVLSARTLADCPSYLQQMASDAPLTPEREAQCFWDGFRVYMMPYPIALPAFLHLAQPWHGQEWYNGFWIVVAMFITTWITVLSTGIVVLIAGGFHRLFLAIHEECRQAEHDMLDSADSADSADLADADLADAAVAAP